MTAVLSSRGSDKALLPLVFYCCGAIALLAFSIWVALEPALLVIFHYNPRTIAAAHLLLLGCLLTMLLGAVLHALPAIAPGRRQRKRMPRVLLALHAPGVVGMVFSFRAGDMEDLGHWGCLVLTSAVLAMIVAWKTTRGIGGPVAGALRSGMLWLLLTVIAGLVFAANKHWHFIPLSPLALAFGHAHMGGVGALLLLLVAVTLQLLPQLPSGSTSQADWIVRGINLSLPLLVTSIWLDWPIGKMAAGLGVVAALFLFGREIISRCRRMRPDAAAPAGLLVSLALWIPAAGAGFALLLWPQPPQFPTLYAILGMLGGIALPLFALLPLLLPFAHRIWPGLLQVAMVLTLSIGVMLQDSAIVRAGGTMLAAVALFWMVQAIGALALESSGHCGAADEKEDKFCASPRLHPRL